MLSQDNTDERLYAQGVCAWAITSFGSVLDNASLWLSEQQAQDAIDTGLLWCQIYMFLATQALQNCRPRYRIRPKLHSFYCEVIQRLYVGNRMNPRYLSCNNEEDFIGKVAAICKGKCHPSSYCKRVLERLLFKKKCALNDVESALK